MAGVVNIITRQQFTGGAINATGGTSYKNDDNQYRGSITLGSGDLTKDKYNAYITFDGQHQNALATFNKRRSYVGSLDLSNYGNANVDLRPGTLGNGNNDNSLSSSSLVGNVRPIDPVTGDAGPYQSLPGCNPANLVGPQQLCAYDYKQLPSNRTQDRQDQCLRARRLQLHRHDAGLCRTILLPIEIGRRRARR